MRKKILAIILFASLVLSMSNVIPANAYSITVSDEDLDKIANAKTVYLDKSFKVTYEAHQSSEYYGNEICSDGYYKIDIGKSKLALVDVQYVKSSSNSDDNDNFGYSIYYLSEGKLETAEAIDCLSGSMYVLDKNKVYYFCCSTNVDVNVTLHNKANDSIQLKKSNKGQITKNFERLYSFKTTKKNNETIIKLNYSSEGATLNLYAIGLDKNNNAFVYQAMGSYDWGVRYDSPWHDILATGKDHYIFLDVDKYTIPTDYKLSYFSGPESKTVEKAKFKKKYTGSTFGVSDSYTYKIKPNYKTKIKVQITGKNVVVTLNNKKIKCKKKVTKTLWVEPAGGGICPGTDLYVNVYKKGLKYDVFNENGTDYSIKITKLKVKK